MEEVFFNEIDESKTESSVLKASQNLKEKVSCQRAINLAVMTAIIFTMPCQSWVTNWKKTSIGQQNRHHLESRPSWFFFGEHRITYFGVNPVIRGLTQDNKTGI